jgi:hypothetical protein
MFATTGSVGHAKANLATHGATRDDDETKSVAVLEICAKEIITRAFLA